MKSKFCFYHPYHPDTWQAMIDCGLVKDGDGVRFSQSLLINDKYKFNNLAAKGTELYNYVKEHNFVPVVDDRCCFIGIILRRDVLNFLHGYYKKATVDKQTENKEKK